MQLPFGPQLMGGPPVGPVPEIGMLPSGFRPPGLAMGGAPGMPQQQGMAMGGVPYIPGLGRNMRNPPAGPNEQAVNKVNDAAGTSDPMAQGAAQVADMMKPGMATDAGLPPGSIGEAGATAPQGSFGGWVSRNIPFLRGLF